MHVNELVIIFDLSCSQGHRFEGWFGSTEDYDRQVEHDLVHCPMCNDAKVTKVPSAKVRIGKSAAPESLPVAAPAAASPPQVAPTPAEFIAQLRAIVKNAEDVGARFADEARKMHYEESPARSIRGQTSREEAEELRDEGIEFASLPAFLVDESH